MLESDPEISTGSSAISLFTENSGELHVEVSRRKFLGPRAGNHYDIFGRQGNFTLVQPEPFANDPFDAVSPNRCRPEPLLHDQAQSMIFEAVRDEIKAEMKGFRSFPRRFDSLEIGGATNSFMRPKTEGGLQRFAFRRSLESISFQTERRFLPFARRRLSTSRPAFVAMRSRKP